MPIAPDLSGCALDGRYELHAVIGEGAFGRVYSGRDRRLERPVAIKMIKPWWAEDPEWVENFEREARLLARVSDPGIVQIFDVGQAAEGLYYVSELVDGESLAVQLRRGALAPWDAAGVAEQLCRALGHAHAQSVVHRDVKPANILFTADGRVKVGDFGVARLAEGSSDGASATIVGTPRYMAPEQARGRAITPATDVYSVGIVLYEMLSGRPPFTERSVVELALRHLNDTPGPLPASTPVELRAIVERALAKSPTHRYRDGREMADALGHAQQSAPPRHAHAHAHTGRTRQRTTAARPPARLAAGAGAVPPVPPRLPARPLRPPPTALPRPHRPELTRRARMSPRRNVNPAGRRRSMAALVLAFALLIGMSVTAVIIGASGHVVVPRLTGLTRAAVRTRARHLSLEPSFRKRYDARVRKGRVIAQTPRAGRRVADGSTIHIVVSAGPPPVTVPPLAGDAAADAQRALAKAGLHARMKTVIAPGVAAGTVTSQSPGPGIRIPRGGRVTLNVAEVPAWKPVTSISGGNHSETVGFHIRGSRWRIVYTMGFQGTCTWVIFCSGPNAVVTGPSASGAGSSSTGSTGTGASGTGASGTGASNIGSSSTGASGTRTGFGLSDGGRQTRGFNSGRGAYRLTVSPGGDDARWTLWVEDYY
jgi:serine/threonine-protein kinase